MYLKSRAAQYPKGAYVNTPWIACVHCLGLASGNKRFKDGCKWCLDHGGFGENAYKSVEWYMQNVDSNPDYSQPQAGRLEKDEIAVTR